MAFLKRANAMVVHPRVSGRGWKRTRRVASAGATNRNLTDQAREILGGALDPDQYLFTHCTIVASVDTEAPPDVKLGKVKVGSKTVDRRYADYLIKPQCSQFVNNNGDSWSRPVLKAAFPTFIGAHNFLEHVQQEEKSKGRIIDAVARDIGDSLYIDILVATSRKHASLVQDIESGKMGTLSMGCTTDFTLCSQCGHFAVDETELCDHIRHAKLNTFMDDQNQKRVIAELCGHIDFTENDDAPGGVRFIEASWVAVPAFPGAVMRNIMATPEGTNKSDSEIRAILASPPQFWSDSAMAKAAKLHTGFDFGGDEGEEGGEAPAEDEAPFKALEDQLYNQVTDRVKKRLQREMREQNTEKALSEDAFSVSDAPNDSIIKEGFDNPARTRSRVAGARREAAAQRYRSALQTLVRVASSDIALVEGVASTNLDYGVRVSRDVYRTALRVGAIHKYPDPKSFRRSVRKTAGRELTPAELRVVVRVSTLLSRWEGFNNPQSRNP
jgi:hypothetical protein